MEEQELISLWKSQSARLDQTLAINYQLLREVKTSKAQWALESLKKLKTTGIVAVIIYLIILGFVLMYAISNYSSAANYFIASMGIIFLINVRALYDYVKHLVWANNINYEGSVTEIQEKLSKLQLSIIKHSRLMSLQFPFWTTFYLSNTWFPQEVGLPYMIFQVTLTGLFCYATYWVLKNLRMENLNKKWFMWLIAGSGGKSTARAIEFVKDINEFKKETEPQIY